MLCFATYGKAVHKTIKETDEIFVNRLLRCIYEPLKIEVKKGVRLYIDKGTASSYLNAKQDKPIHNEIISGSGAAIVIESAVEYFATHVCPYINPIMQADMIENLVKLIRYDATIGQTTKDKLLALANEETLADFLASTLLYAVNKPNVILEKITVHTNLPEQNRYFRGRADQFMSIYNLFKKQENNTVNICQTVSGLGGVGKTQLSIEYAYRFCGSYKNCIWFINAETTTTTQNYFVEFAKHFKLPLSPDFKPDDLHEVVKIWLSNNKEWLLIFDNLESADTIKPYLPSKINGRIIITTRNTRIDFGSQITLGVFNMDEALDFLKRRLSNDEELRLDFYNHNSNDFETEAPNLINRLGFLPLALEQAAAYIKEERCTITKYLLLLSQSGLKAFEVKSSAPENYEKIVTATWNISFKAINCEGSRQLLNLCAYMAPDRIPVAFFAEMREKLPSPIKEDMADEIRKNSIVSDLRTYSLTSGDADYINVHRLVQEVVRKSHSEDAV